MTETSPPVEPPAANTQDRDHLWLLSIFHYVVAGIAALVGSIPLIHFALGAAMASGVFDRHDGPPAAIGCVMMAFAGFFVLCGWAFAALLALAGRSLAQQQRYTFCLVMAAISCAFAPFGTVLGVFTLIVLLRPSVKQLFGQTGALGSG